MGSLPMYERVLIFRKKDGYRDDGAVGEKDSLAVHSRELLRRV